MIVLYVRDNLPKAYDLKFLLDAFDVMARGKHIPSGKFNGGEKVWFWGGVVVLSVVVTWSGLILLFPNFDQTRAVMQDAWIWHAVRGAALHLDLVRPHVPRHDRRWKAPTRRCAPATSTRPGRRSTTSIWYDEMKASARQPAAGGAVPAGAPHTEEKS